MSGCLGSQGGSGGDKVSGFRKYFEGKVAYWRWSVERKRLVEDNIKVFGLKKMRRME